MRNATVDALVVPIRKEDGSFANVNAYYAIKDVTQIQRMKMDGWRVHLKPILRILIESKPRFLFVKALKMRGLFTRI